MEWIKVIDKKPKHNLGVLVLIPDEDNHMTSGMLDHDDTWVLLDEYRVPEKEVTHWMPLPNLPTEFADTQVEKLNKVDVTRSKSVAYKIGYRACSNGDNIDSYKYHKGTEQYKDWLAGFIERASEKDNE